MWALGRRRRVGRGACDRGELEIDEKWVALWVTTICAWRGDLDEARQCLAMAEQDLDRNEVQNVVDYQTLEAIVLLAEGKPAEALQSAEVALERRSDDWARAGRRHAPYRIGGSFRAGGPGEGRRVARDRRAGTCRLVDSLVEGDRRPLRRPARRAAGRPATAAAGFSAAARISRRPVRRLTAPVCSSTPSGSPARAGSMRRRRSPPRRARSSSASARRLTSSGWIGCR